jgi:arylsulfatase A-like enzyme
MPTKLILVLLLLIACGCAGESSHAAVKNAASAAKGKPNIIVIVADDLGYADIGAQKISKDVRTPNVDSIAASGVRFTNGYVSCPVCSPSRAGFLTGCYQERFGHEFNPGGNDPNIFGLPLDQVLLPQELKKAGYSTGMVGKWHEGTRDGYYPTERGFDSFFGFLGGAHSYTKLEPKGRNAILRDKTPVQESEYLTDAFAREAAAYIDGHIDRPFFLYLAFYAVHSPQEVPQKYLDRFPNESDKKRQLMLAMLSAMDDGVGKVLERVRAHQLEEDTLIFFFSDNGGPTAGNGSRNDPLSGFKGQVWEGGVRIPFCIQWKNHIAPRVIDHPVIALDIFPTACAAGSATAPKNVDGVNLMPLLLGESSTAPHDALYWRYSPQRAVRSGNYKLVQFGHAPTKLFDLSSDIGEKNDLAAAKPQVVAELESKYAAWNAKNMPPRWHQKSKFEDNVSSDEAQKSPKAARQERPRVRRRAATQAS